MKFKSSKQKSEFNNPQLDSRLRTIAFALDGFSQFFFNKEIIITDIFRARDEQVKIYTDRKWIKTIPYSVHEFWRGLDIRSWIYEIDEIRKLCKFLNKSFEYTGKHKTVTVHKIGDGKFHFHCQVDSDGETILRKI